MIAAMAKATVTFDTVRQIARDFPGGYPDEVAALRSG